MNPEDKTYANHEESSTHFLKAMQMSLNLIILTEYLYLSIYGYFKINIKSFFFVYL